MRNKILRILEKNDFVSGEYLAKNLNVSRTTIWKQIKSFQKNGYVIESIKNKGYKLKKRPDIPYEEEIIPYIKTKKIGKKIKFFNSVNSTNESAKKFIKKNIEEGTIVIAESQIKGRGRKKRFWYSPVGGLWFSIILYPNIPPQKGMLLTMISSISVAEAIKEYLKINTNIKWPNDLVIENKKFCGILTEIDGDIDRINYSIIGVGINVNNDINAEMQNKAISLKSKYRGEIKKVKLLISILEKIDFYYDYLIEEKYNFIKEKWLEHSNIIGKKVMVSEDNKKIYGKVIDIDDYGSIIINNNEKSRKVVTGDLKFI